MPSAVPLDSSMVTLRKAPSLAIIGALHPGGDQRLAQVGGLDLVAGVEDGVRGGALPWGSRR